MLASTRVVILLALVSLSCTVNVMGLYQSESGSGEAAATPNQDQILFINTTCEDEGFHSEIVLPDVMLALNVVNDALSTKKSGLNVSIVNVDTRGSSSLPFLLDHFLPTARAVLYPGCSLYTGILADISRRLFNLSVVIYVFPSFLVAHHTPLLEHYQMFPSEKHLASGIASFITNYNWKRTVILTQDIPIFTTIFEELKDFLEEISVNVTSKILIEESEIDGNEIFPPDNRVFVLNMHPVYARAVLCEAFHSGRFYPGYVWITYGWYSDQWWRDEGMNKMDNCSNGKIVSVLEGAIAVNHYPTVSSTHPSLQTRHPFRTYAVSAFDAIILLARRVLYPDIEIDPLLFDVTVNDLGVRDIDNITFFQYRNDSNQLLIRTVIGSVQLPGNLTLREGEDEFSLWPHGVPSDGTPETVENYPLLPLMVVCYTAATAGIAFAIVCLVLNIVFRNKKLIRLTSPNINYIIILGAIIFYGSIYEFFYLPGTSETWIAMLCNVRLWFASIGYVLTYVPISVKMWRVYYICRKPRPSMKNVFIKDWHLVLIIGIFVILDLLMLIIVTVADTSRYTVKIIPDKEHPGTSINDDGITISYTVSRCYSATEPYWIVFLFGYKLLMQVVGVILAFNIRKVKIKGLNDSKEISAILYITTVIIGIIILVTFVFGDYINVDGGTYGLGITTATTVVLTFIFVPKMYGLYRDPKGEKIFSRTEAQNNSSALQKTSDCMEDNKLVIDALKKRIKELEAMLGDREKAKDVHLAGDVVESPNIDCNTSVE